MHNYQASLVDKSHAAEGLPMKLVTETTSRARAFIDCRAIATAREKWQAKAREYFYLQPSENDARANSELIGTMTAVGDDYDYQAAIAKRCPPSNFNENCPRD